MMRILNDYRTDCNIFKENKIPERVVMQVLPVGGTYNAMEEEKRRLEEERLRREREERARKQGGCPACSVMVGKSIEQIN